MALGPVHFPTLGFQVVAWYEHFLCHGIGDVEGADWHLDDELALFFCWLYRLYPAGHREEGRRLAHRGILSRAKGRAKSEAAGGFVCGEALGPVRFSDWAEGGETTDWGYTYMPGEPIGQPVHSPMIRCLATEETQAGNTYDNVYVMLTQGRASEWFGLREGKEVGLTRTFLPGGGEIRPSTSGNASKDGGLESAAVGDETHLYVENKLRGMYRTVARNTGKRKIAEPLMLDTTTMYQPGERSIAEQADDRYGGRDPDEVLQTDGVLYDHREGDKPKRFGDNRSLIKAMKTAYGPAADWMDFKRIVRIIRDAEDPEEEAYRYYLNRKRVGSAQWLAPELIKEIIVHEVAELGSKIALGFDGSENDDHTALVGCTQDGLLFPVGIWTPTGDDFTWREKVDDAVRWTFDNFQVIRFYADPPWWQEYLSNWARDLADPTRAGTLPVMAFWTQVDSKMSKATGGLRTAVRQKAARLNPAPLRTEPINEKGQPLMVRHFENARTKRVRIKLEDRAENAWVITKDRPGSPNKIDSATSSVLAWEARNHAQSEREFDEPEYGRASWG